MFVAGTVLAGVGVATLIGDAGLTHGGFDSHFASKKALIEEVIDFGIDETFARITEATRRGGMRISSVTIFVAAISSIRREVVRQLRWRPRLAGTRCAPGEPLRGNWGGWFRTSSRCFPARTPELLWPFSRLWSSRCSCLNAFRPRTFRTVPKGWRGRCDPSGWTGSWTSRSNSAGSA